MKMLVDKLSPHGLFEATVRLSFCYGGKYLVYLISDTLPRCYEVVGFIVVWEEQQRIVTKRITLAMIKNNLDTYMNRRNIFFTCAMKDVYKQKIEEF